VGLEKGGGGVPGAVWGGEGKGERVSRIFFGE